MTSGCAGSSSRSARRGRSSPRRRAWPTATASTVGRTGSASASVAGAAGSNNEVAREQLRVVSQVHRGMVAVLPVVRARHRPSDGVRRWPLGNFQTHQRPATREWRQTNVRLLIMRAAFVSYACQTVRHSSDGRAGVSSLGRHLFLSTIGLTRAVDMSAPTVHIPATSP